MAGEKVGRKVRWQLKINDVNKVSQSSRSQYSCVFERRQLDFFRFMKTFCLYPRGFSSSKTNALRVVDPLLIMWVNTWAQEWTIPMWGLTQSPPKGQLLLGVKYLALCQLFKWLTDWFLYGVSTLLEHSKQFIQHVIRSFTQAFFAF